jgi:Xaa-Pro aminopeptidase
MKTSWKRLGMLGLALSIPIAAQPRMSKEFLTPQEIARIQDAQEIDQRVKVYMEAAALRLKTVAERLAGKESMPEDPLEFFSVEDMLDGYYQILRAVMLNIDDASRKPGVDPAKIQTALKRLKAVTDAGAKQLEALKKTAEEQKREEAWNLIVKAIDINKGAQEGAAGAIKKSN